MADFKDKMVHLHVHSEYSLLDGAIRIPELLDRALFLGHKAVAITDHGNLFGAVDFYMQAKKKGIKAIIGSEIFHPGGNTTAKVAHKDGPQPPSAFHLVLLARNDVGYHNLIKVVSGGYLEGLREVPVCPERSLDQYGEGTIALSACQNGELGYLVRCLRTFQGDRGPLRWAPPTKAGQECLQALQDFVERMQSRFGTKNFYVELIDNNLPEQKSLLKDLVATAEHFQLPMVATADAHYLTEEQAEAHAILLGIKHGLTMTQLRGRRKATRFHLLANEEMSEVYRQWPEAIANTNVIADQCEVEFSFDNYHLPAFTQIDEKGEQLGVDSAELLQTMSRSMLEERFIALRKVYGEAFDNEQEQLYRDRLEFELQVIIKMGFPGYFLIVQDFINWAKRQGIPVGPGRGSGAGSLVAYALRITDIDPIPYNLIFERFLNPDRVSMPDFDIDFCQDRRDEVVQYVTERYGKDRVAQITTFGKMNAKAVIRDVGRVLEMSYMRVDRIAKLIPDDLGITLEDALSREPRLSEEAARDEQVAELLRFAQELEGLTRHCSVHAAGIVISDQAMIEHVPVYTTEEDGLITQFEMKKAEAVGLIKFDFLGLKTLTVIDKAVELIREGAQPDFDINLIPMNDRPVFQLISQAHTTGVFQLESGGMRQLVAKLKPSCFEDIIPLVALFRPGPLGSGMVDDFIERKHGRQTINYPHPDLEEVLKETYGIILYQEQVMEIAVSLASYTLGEADLLRRAMGKKIASEMTKQKDRFITGAIGNGITEAKAAEIFDLMAEFANYGFNKSHSAAYGLIAYQTAYLKAHFAEYFMAAIMTCDLDNTSKIIRYLDDCRRQGIEIIPPNINEGELEFRAAGSKAIQFGLAAIKGTSAQALAPLVEERRRHGAFQSLTEMAKRVELAKVGKKNLELLNQVGAFDCFEISRPRIHELIAEIVRFSEQHHDAKASGQGGLFDDEQENLEANWEIPDNDRVAGAPSPEWLQKERKLIGVYLTGHPLDFFPEDVKAFSTMPLKDLPRATGQRVQIVAAIVAIHERLTKSGSRMAGVRLEDQNSAVEGVMFQNEIPDEFPESGTLVVAVGTVEKGFDGRAARFRIESLTPLEEQRREYIRSAAVVLAPKSNMSAPDQRSIISHLHQIFSSHQGDTPTDLLLTLNEATIKIRPEGPGVDLSDSFLNALRKISDVRPEVKYIR